MKNLNVLEILRCFVPDSLNEDCKISLHTFCDASIDAIGYVTYLKFDNDDHTIHDSFVRFGSKLSPNLANTIPRSELCAVVQLQGPLCLRQIAEELSFTLEKEVFYTDCKKMCSNGLFEESEI